MVPAWAEYEAGRKLGTAPFCPKAKHRIWDNKAKASCFEGLARSHRPCNGLLLRPNVPDIHHCDVKPFWVSCCTPFERTFSTAKLQIEVRVSLQTYYTILLDIVKYPNGMITKTNTLAGWRSLPSLLEKKCKIVKKEALATTLVASAFVCLSTARIWIRIHHLKLGGWGWRRCRCWSRCRRRNLDRGIYLNSAVF